MIRESYSDSVRIDNMPPTQSDPTRLKVSENVPVGAESLTTPLEVNKGRSNSLSLIPEISIDTMQEINVELKISADNENLLSQQVTNIALLTSGSLSENNINNIQNQNTQPSVDKTIKKIAPIEKNQQLTPDVVFKTSISNEPKLSVNALISSIQTNNLTSTAQKSVFEINSNHYNNTVDLPNIIGLPPLPERFLNNELPGNLENNYIIDSMPILELTPCLPRVAFSFDAFQLESAWGELTPGLQPEEGGDLEEKTILNNYTNYLFYCYGVNITKLSQSFLRVCILNESGITESFSNEFGDTIFADIAQGISSSFIRDLTAGANIINFDTLTDQLGMAGEMLSGVIPGGEKMVNDAKNKAKMVQERVKNASSNISNNTKSMLSNMGSAMMHSVLGHGLDFPQIWRSANFSPSYSFTVKLYNPLPQSQEATAKYIYGPLAALMAFVVPRSPDGKFFYAPFYCKFRIRGLIPEYVGYVRNITVIKGGDQNLVSLNQIVGEVALKIDIGILYKTMTAGPKSYSAQSPQLADWLQELVSKGKPFTSGDFPNWYNVNMPVTGNSLQNKQSNGLTPANSPPSNNPNNITDANKIINGAKSFNPGNIALANDLLQDPIASNSNVLGQLTGLITNTITNITNTTNNVATKILQEGDSLTIEIKNNFSTTGYVPIIAIELLTLVPYIVGPTYKQRIRNIAENLKTLSETTTSTGIDLVANLINSGTNLMNGVSSEQAGTILSTLTNSAGDILTLMNETSTYLIEMGNEIIEISQTQTGSIATALETQGNNLISISNSLNININIIITNIVTSSNDLLTKIGKPTNSIIKGAADASILLLTKPPKYELDQLKNIVDQVPTPEEQLHPEKPNPTNRVPISPITNYKTTRNSTSISLPTIG